jgi:hypothetical protein
MICNRERSDQVEGDFSETTENILLENFYFRSSPFCVSLLYFSKGSSPIDRPKGFPGSITRTWDHYFDCERRVMRFNFETNIFLLQNLNYWNICETGEMVWSCYLPPCKVHPSRHVGIVSL